MSLWQEGLTQQQIDRAFQLTEDPPEGHEHAWFEDEYDDDGCCQCGKALERNYYEWPFHLLKVAERDN